MTPAANLDQTVESICARVDHISTALLVDGISGIQAEDLDSLAADADQQGSSGAAELARSLASQMRARPQNENELRQALDAGLPEYQRLLGQAQSVSAGESADSGQWAESSSFADDPKLVAEFLVEAREHLALIESQMLELEKDPHAMEVLHSVFRTFHTIKGLAGFLEFGAIQAVAHEVETSARSRAEGATGRRFDDRGPGPRRR